MKYRELAILKRILSGNRRARRICAIPGTEFARRANRTCRHRIFEYGIKAGWTRAPEIVQLKLAKDKSQSVAARLRRDFERSVIRNESTDRRPIFARTSSRKVRTRQDHVHTLGSQIYAMTKQAAQTRRNDEPVHGNQWRGRPTSFE